MIISHLDADGSLTPPLERALGAFGEKLRQQREQRGIALDAISNTTKISTRMLRALEDEHFDQLPGGVFNKGFVRAYARQVGLNEEEAVADYLAALRESQIQAQAILPDFRTPARKPLDVAPPSQELTPNHDLGEHEPHDPVIARDRGNNHRGHNLRQPDRRKQNRRDEDRAHPNQDQPKPDHPIQDRVDHDGPALAVHPPDTSPAVDPRNSTTVLTHEHDAAEPAASIPWRKLGAALVLVVAALAFWNLYRRDQAASAPPTAAASTTSSNAGSAISAPAPATAVPAKSSDSRKSAQPGHSLPGGAIYASTAPLISKPASIASPVAASAASSGRVSSNAGAATPLPANVVSHASAAKPPASFTLLIRAEKTSWVSIVADGNPVAEETLIAPAHTSVRASREIVVKAGNAAGISFILNGKEIPAQGNEGEVKTYSFDATTAHVVP